MTDPQIQIAVAKACGWMNTDHVFIPSYISSHDAMAGALGTMTKQEWRRYEHALIEEVSIGDSYTVVELLKATPLQQAVAFLKATNNYTP